MEAALFPVRPALAAETAELVKQKTAAVLRLFLLRAVEAEAAEVVVDRMSVIMVPEVARE